MFFSGSKFDPKKVLSTAVFTIPERSRLVAKSARKLKANKMALSRFATLDNEEI